MHDDEQFDSRPATRLTTVLGALAAVSTALALTFTLSPTTSAAPAASAAGTVRAAAPDCPAGKVCMWAQRDFQGHRYDWSPDEGNVFLGNHGLADKVASFVARADGCFQDSPPPGNGRWHRFAAGQSDPDFVFGRAVDRIKPGC
ncbi:peptidase inhibitor family I36 protein [Streptomyces sp. MMBL 11-3]|uniref:peptidase inhibitor family I36 protein n=1 Tax=Streptomyces sp. MMBL 11-3 TaxID=3382639 RepID=UPI0039B69E32